MTLKWSDMTEEQKLEKFQEYVEKREGKAAQNKAKNKARTAIINKFRPEFDQALRDAMKTVKVEKPNEQKIKEIVQSYIEKKVKGKARQEARKNIINAHKDEYQKELAKFNKEAE